MRSFENIAKLIRDTRTTHAKNYSQVELSSLLGYKNGQFISNVERGLCSIPLKMLSKVSQILDIPRDTLSSTLLKDYAATVENHINANAGVDSLASAQNAIKVTESTNI